MKRQEFYQIVKASSMYLFVGVVAAAVCAVYAIMFLALLFAVFA